MGVLDHLLIEGPVDAQVTLALAHGAGAPMDSDWMNTFTAGLSDQGVRVVRFEFPYMFERRQTGVKKPPNRAPVLIETWQEVIDHLGVDNLVIGGKSMGGRIASMVADEAGVRGLVCLGYPFHPPGRPEKTRTEHLETLQTKTLICQGTRDSLGSRDDVSAYALSGKIEMFWLEDGDHGFKPRKKSGFTEQGNYQLAIDKIVNFVSSL